MYRFDLLFFFFFKYIKLFLLSIKLYKIIIVFKLQKSSLDLSKTTDSSDKKPDTLIISKVISITEPIDSPKTPSDEILKTPDDSKKNLQTPTITEENEIDDNSTKSCLSLPVEPPPCGLPIEKDRRKLSVQGLMAFAERRRSSSTFSDMRKMSVSNGDGVHIRSPGGIGKY